MDELGLIRAQFGLNLGQLGMNLRKLAAYPKEPRGYQWATLDCYPKGPRGYYPGVAPGYARWSRGTQGYLQGAQRKALGNLECINAM